MRLIPAAHQIELGRPAAAAPRSSVDRLDEAPAMLGAPPPAARIRPVLAPDRLRGDASRRRAARRRPDAGQELHHAKARDAVARVLRPAQDGEHVLDVRGFEKLEPAELHERNVAPGQLELERRRCGARRGTAPPAIFSASPASRFASTRSTT